jgi:hypothetical protein
MVRMREFLSPLSLNVITDVRYNQLTAEKSWPNLQTLIYVNNIFICRRNEKGLHIKLQYWIMYE